MPLRFLVDLGLVNFPIIFNTKYIFSLENNLSKLSETKKTKKKQATLCEKCPYSELLWCIFSCIQTEYGSVRMRENKHQNYSEYGNFLRGATVPNEPDIEKNLHAEPYIQYEPLKLNNNFRKYLEWTLMSKHYSRTGIKPSS